MPLHIASVRDEFAKDANRTIKALIAGPPGSGKTRTASTWPNPIYADAEGRLLSVRDRDILAARIDNIRDLEELKAMLAQDSGVRTRMFGRPVDTVILDTVDEIARLIIKERLRSEKREQMSMQDWGYLADTLRGILRGFRNLRDMNVLFLVHLKSQEDSETGRTYFKPAIQGSVGDEIAGYVDEAFLMVARPVIDQATGNRVIRRHLQTGPDPQHDWVKDHSGSLPLEFPIDFETDAERMAKIIFGETQAVPETPLEVTSSAAVAEISTSEPEAVPVAKVVPTEPPPRKAKSGRPTKAPVADVPLPEPVVEAPHVEPLIATPEAPAAEPEPIIEEPTVPETGTEIVDDDPLADLGVDADGAPTCSECGVVIDPPDYAEFSEVRYGVKLCRTHFTARAKRK